MGRKKVAGLINRKGIWHIDKVVRGRRLCESTGESHIERAEEYLARRIDEIRQAEIFGVRPKRTWRQAATKFLSETDKASIRCDASYLKMMDPFIGGLSLTSIHMATLQPFIELKKQQGRKKRTINYALQVVRHILNLAAGEWMDEHGLTWLAAPPKIKLLTEDDKRSPYPMSWEEQLKLFSALPGYLAKMALFAVNTGCREQEVCGLRWEWEIPIPELSTNAFIIPGKAVKNRQDRLVVLNKVAKAVVEEMRGVHLEYVFSYRGKRLRNMNNRAWKETREKVGLRLVRVHDLKHTFGRRLRSAGVSFEDRQDLMGHKSSRITTHYSKAEIANLIAAANVVCEQQSRKSPALVILNKKIHPEPVKQLGGNAT
ncbi:MAG: tyrosine-type recombinase/integrase [Desulfomonilaceae bacterium]